MKKLLYCFTVFTFIFGCSSSEEEPITQERQVKATGISAANANVGDVTSIGGQLRIRQNEPLNSLSGLDNLEAIAEGGIEIQFNYSLSDFCALTKVLANGFDQYYNAQGNAFNPSEENILLGICKQ